MYNFIVTTFLVVGGATPACHTHEHQQRREVGFGLIYSRRFPLARCKAESLRRLRLIIAYNNDSRFTASFSPLLVFVQLALKLGFHQQHLPDV